MKLSLVVAQGKPEGREIPIRLPQFLIGRDPECHLRPVSPLVSKRHCALLIRDEKAYLRDFGSTNGSLVNGQQVQGEVEIKDGDELRLGPLNFRVKLVPTPQEARPSSADTISEETSTSNTGVHATARTGGQTPAPKPAKKSTDEDDVFAEMLFNLGGDEARSTAGKEEVPVDTTIMTNMAAETTDEEGRPGAKPDSRPSKLKIDHQATSNAAKAILDKYMKRPRT